MDRQCMLNMNVQNYIREFYCILDQMIEGMTSAPLTNSISRNFIAQMIPHHRAAIEMSCNILRYTRNTRLQEIAFQIIQEQTKSIENMQEIECICRNCINCNQDLCSYQNTMDEIMQVMFTRMDHARCSNNIGANFIREMIPHHEGAIEMSNTILQYEICPQLKPILEAIITSQERGVSQMKELLQCLNE